MPMHPSGKPERKGSCSVPEAISYASNEVHQRLNALLSQPS